MTIRKPIVLAGGTRREMAAGDRLFVGAVPAYTVSTATYTIDLSQAPDAIINLQADSVITLTGIANGQSGTIIIQSDGAYQAALVTAPLKLIRSSWPIGTTDSVLNYAANADTVFVARSGLIAQGARVYSACRARNTGRIYTTGQYGNLYSDDNGATFRPGNARDSNSGISYGIACSASGLKILCTPGGYLQLSVDAGVTFNALTPFSTAWARCAMSDDGQKMFACTSTAGGTVLSADGGATWGTPSAFSARQGWGAAMSSNGQVIVAGSLNEVLVSNDGGATWNARALSGAGTCWGAAVSGDGTKILAAGTGNLLFKSTDSGATFSQVTSFSIAASPFGLGMSDDASLIVVTTTQSGGSVVVSNDGGTTWNTRSVVAGFTGYGCAVAQDASRIIVSSPNIGLYTSTDLGVTFTRSALVGSH